MKFSRGHWFEVSIWYFYSFDQQGNHCCHARPRVLGGVSIVGTHIAFGDCREEVNFLEVTKVNYRPSPKRCLRKFRLSHNNQKNLLIATALDFKPHKFRLIPT